MQVLPIEERRFEYRRYLPLDKLPRELISGRVVQYTPTPISWNPWSRTEIKEDEEERSTSSIELNRETDEEVNQGGPKEGSIFGYQSIVRTLFGEGPRRTPEIKMERAARQQLPYVSIAMPMEDGDDRISNVAQLPTFHGRTGSDPD